MMLALLDFLLGGRSGLYRFESRIIHEVQSRLEDGAPARLTRQIEVINKVKRLSDGKEVNLYQMRRGKPIFDDGLRFSTAVDETLLATVSLLGPDRRAELRVDVWLAKGRLFSLVFNEAPKRFFAGMNLATIQPEIADVQIWVDPMLPDAGVGVNKPGDGSALTGWLREWYARGEVSSVRAALPQLDRSRYLARINAQLPQDYLELVAQTDGVTLAKWVVYGPARIRQIVLADANFYLLAELQGVGALAVKDGSGDSELYMLHYEEDDAQAVGTSFEKAVAKWSHT